MGHVPLRYHGLWQRTLYAEPANGEPTYVDRDTQVYWLQAGDWHADLRVPGERPDFSGVGSLDDCSHEQLIWLAGQTAFAGITRVEGHFCSWHRLVDLSPGLEKDLGVMRFVDENTLEERQPVGRYRELWSRVSQNRKAEPIVQFDADGLPAWLEYGDHAMAVTARAGIAPAHDLLADPATLTTTVLRERTALEISFAERADDGWQIRLSTLPWLEGRSIAG
ncbi:hypothetical protein SADO_12184 [Salinisphaera dokdonensis CL-ES53]|uniref:Uncharacterized protein n=1 Tax=Salinisphaera dokdonensis CL-ES53 TaxID=1304272 RepID=A0ABV2B2A6_9GAMM